MFGTMPPTQLYLIWGKWVLFSNGKQWKWKKDNCCLKKDDCHIKLRKLKSTHEFPKFQLEFLNIHLSFKHSDYFSPKLISLSPPSFFHIIHRIVIHHCIQVIGSSVGFNQFSFLHEEDEVTLYVPALPDGYWLPLLQLWCPLRDLISYSPTKHQTTPMLIFSMTRGNQSIILIKNACFF